MSFQIFNMIAGAFFNIFGGALLLPFAILGTLGLILLSMKAGKVVFLIVTLPLVTTWFVVGTSKFFAGMTASAQWVPVAMWLMAGLFMAGVFWKILQ